ncbi:glycosyl transferase, partial [Salmonella enterica subsp. enterica serovar Typhimurium]
MYIRQGNTLTSLHACIPQIVFGHGADRPVNARAVVERGCGIIPGMIGLSSCMFNTFLGYRALREASLEAAAEMAAQPCP